MGVETQNEGFTAPGPAALKSSFSAFDYVSNELLTLRLDKMDGIGGMFVMIPLVYATKNVEWTDERILYARIAFGVVQALIVVVLLMVKSKISKAASETKITVPKAAPSPWSQSDETEEMTVEEYDTKEWSNLFYQGTLMQIAIIGFISYKFETVIPLISQVVMGPFRIYGHNLVKAHLLGQDVKRPFPAPKSPFADLLGGAKDEQPGPKKDKKKKE
jgi:hypothetical protein